MKFFSVHNHTQFSNLRLRDSLIKENELIDQARSLGYNGVCITDHECLSGHVRILNHYNKTVENKDEFKLGLGNEIYLVNDIESLKEKGGRHYHLVLVAKNLEGYTQLRQLSSQSWENMFIRGNMTRVPITYNQFNEIIGDNKGNLICSTACLGGFFGAKVLEWVESQYTSDSTKAEIHNFISWGINTFGKDDFYIEIQPNTESSEQCAFNRVAINIANAYGLKYIVTTDSHYLTKEDADIHECFLTADDSSKDREVKSFYATTYMMQLNEMCEHLGVSITYEEFVVAVNNTQCIFNSIEYFDISSDIVIPQRELEDFVLSHLFKEYYSEFKYISNFAHSEHEQDRYLLYLIEKGFIEKSRNFEFDYLKRIDTELEELWEISSVVNKRMSSYYNITQLLIEIMFEISLVGVARGSSTGFEICYLLNIVQISGYDHNLPHWRHLNKGRAKSASDVSLADIDIDTEGSKRNDILVAMQEYFGENSILNIVTFKTEGAKSSIQTACRGLFINGDVANEIASLIRVERGQAWSIEDMLFGNEEKERKPVTEFINKVNKHEGLREAILKIQSLINGYSVHACGVFIYDKNGFIGGNNSLMKTKDGTRVTAYSMVDSEQMGNMKFDFLSIDALTKIRTCMDLLLRQGKIEWQGSLKATYEKYLHPDVLEYNDPKMWELLGEGVVQDVFQFSTGIGIQTAKKLKPSNLDEMAQCNSLMRLSCDGEQPIDTYLRYRANIQEWYNDISKYGLNDKEIDVLKKHIEKLCYVATTQEDLMIMTMDNQISNFTLQDADKARKSIAKKKYDLLMEVRDMFFTKGLACGSRKEFLEYIWEEQFMKQAGYSFSLNHTLPYSVIGLQELNLYHRFGGIYWDCACLISNSGSGDIDKGGVTDYGKIAIAIENIKKEGVTVTLPDINSADFTFTPHVESNSIVYGLFAITSINMDTVKTIIENRPYFSMNDFLNKTKLSKSQNINLIKAGCFDKLEGRDRVEIMKDYVKTLIKPKNVLTATNLLQLAELGLTPNELETRFVRYRKYITNKAFIYNSTEKAKSDTLYILNEVSTPFFEEYFIDDMEEGVHYVFDNMGRIVISKNKFDKIYKSKIINLLNWIKTDDAVKLYNEVIFNTEYAPIDTSMAKWEMDALSYYYTSHEVDDCDLDAYGIEDFFELSEVPVVASEKVSKKGRVFKKFELTNIIGTVVSKDTTRHTISLATPTGVVDVKFTQGAFAHYNKQISVLNENTGKKEVLDVSWFRKGTILIIKGYRQDTMFRPKVYDNPFALEKTEHTVRKVVGLQDNGLMTLQTDRNN